LYLTAKLDHLSSGYTGDGNRKEIGKKAMTESASRPPAPGPLALVEEFINSRELPDGDDELATPDQAASWLRSRGTEAEMLSDRDLRRLTATREALRDLLEAHTGENVDPDVSVRLQKLLGGAAMRPVLSPQGLSLVADTKGAEGFLGRLAAAIIEATLTGTWERLKVCRSDRCRWAYYDHSKNGRGAWCSMRTCGTREKARAYRARQREPSAAG
jgi:predicted RNA-binding Zn ribbon-like protein